ncbi:S8 family serine peptidase [Halocatena halophila]|uniref:S8 family serine peptidase n=1 Tax=Halocatena halophila TaxID=2814576 RepID=UPI002ED1859A
MTQRLVRSAFVLVVVTTVLLSFSLGPPQQLSATTTEWQSFGTDPFDRTGLLEHNSSVPAVDSRVDVAITTASESGVLKSISNGGSPLGTFQLHRIVQHNDKRVVYGSIPMDSIRSFMRATNASTVQIRNGPRRTSGRQAAGIERVNATAVHEHSITGENVTVGVIDSGFRPSHPEIAGKVSTYARFGQPTDAEHGTAVASVVTDTAPNASLALAAIGEETTPTEYQRAVRWLNQSGVDIIIDAGSYYSQPANGSGAIDQIVHSTADDLLFVTSVGNHRLRYWNGTHTTGKWVQIANDTQVNPLNDGRSFSGSVSLTLRWNRSAPEYDLSLYRRQPGTDAMVAETTGSDNDSVAHLQTTVPHGTYYVSIEQTTPMANATTPTELELFATRRLGYRSPSRPASPATVETVLSVGSYTDESIPDHSVSNPSLVAPSSVAVDGLSVTGGTSFAAPYVAGVGALVMAADSSIEPATVRTRLLESADDVGTQSNDPRSGMGLLNATRAVGCSTATDELSCPSE